MKKVAITFSLLFSLLLAALFYRPPWAAPQVEAQAPDIGGPMYCVYRREGRCYLSYIELENGARCYIYSLGYGSPSLSCLRDRGF